MNQEWCSSLDVRAAAFDDPEATVSAKINRLVNGKNQTAGIVGEHIDFLFESLPKDVATSESIDFVQEMIDGITNDYRAMVRQDWTADEKRFLIDWFELDISIWKQVIQALTESKAAA